MLAWNRLRAMIALAALAAAPAAGQAPAQDHPECGTELTPELAAKAWELYVSGAYEVGPRPEGVVYVPLTFHVVRNSEGKWPHPPYLTPQVLQAALDLANEHFAPAGIQFCQPGPTLYIDDDTHHYWQGGATREWLYSRQPVAGTINCYFVRGLTVGSRSSFTFSPLPHGILMTIADMPGPTRYSPVFSHELGHYFDLFHTFETMFGLECTSGSNCDIAGDLVCDTPADPGGGAWPNCGWGNPAPGPCPGDPLYDPPLRNLMSYRDNCRDHFTAEQGERALATLLNLRTELDLNLCNRACYADCDGDGVLDPQDFLCFQASFLAGEPYADCDSNGMLDFFDFLCFQNEFLAGCP